MYDRRGHRILNGTSTTPSRKGSESPLNARASPSRPRTSPFLKPIRRAHGATPPPAEMDEVCAMRWRKYNAILESICRDSPDDESPPPRPPAFDYRGVELIAALAPGFGKFLFLAKAKSFAWWKNSTAKVTHSCMRRQLARSHILCYVDATESLLLRVSAESFADETHRIERGCSADS